MALVLNKRIFGICNSHFSQPTRFRSKINIQKPRAPHFERAKYNEVAKPWFISTLKDKPRIELCSNFKKLKEDDEDNPYQNLVAKHLREILISSKLVAFYHLNPMTADEHFKAVVAFAKQNMLLKQFGKKTLQIATQGTPYETILDFYVSRNTTVFSPEANIKKLLQIGRKFPRLVLLTALYEGRLVSKDELVEYSQIPNIQAAQAGLVQVLNNVGTHLVSQLNTHQNNLVSNLEERAKQLQEQ